MYNIHGCFKYILYYDIKIYINILERNVNIYFIFIYFINIYID